jgi:hypothetical protein
MTSTLWIGLICPFHNYQFYKTDASNVGFTHCVGNDTNEEKIDGRKGVKEKRGIRLKILPDDLKKKRGYLKPEEEALDRNSWRCRVGRRCGPVLRQTTE